MRTAACWVLSLVLLIAGGGLSGRDSDAYPIFTAKIEAVLPCASDVVRVRWPTGTDPGLVVERVFRGEAKVGRPIVLHSLPGVIFWRLRRGTFRSPLPDRKEVEPVGLFLALYEMDGRFHVVGSRPTHGIPDHSSVWLIGDDGQVYTYRQIINPGGVTPVPADPSGLEAFETALEKRLVASPFKGADHRPLPKQRAKAFLALTEPAIEWYERRLADHTMTGEDRFALGLRVERYGETAPKEMAIHVFDALQFLAPSNHYASGHENGLVNMMTRIVRRFGVSTFETLIIDELDHGPYMSRNRSALLTVAKRTDADLYKRAVSTLVALGKRQHSNEGLAAYFALEENGEAALAKEVQQAQGWSK